MERHEGRVLGMPRSSVSVKDRRSLLEAWAAALPLQEKKEPVCVLEQVLERVFSGLRMWWSKPTMDRPVSQGNQAWVWR